MYARVVRGSVDRALIRTETDDAQSTVMVIGRNDGHDSEGGKKGGFLAPAWLIEKLGELCRPESPQGCFLLAETRYLRDRAAHHD